jgi:hypothetical protein
MDSIEILNKAIGELAKREHAYGEALEAAAVAEHTYRIKKNREILGASGTDKVKLAIAEIACEEEMLIKLTADAHKEFLKTKCDDARTVISARKEIAKIEDYESKR